MPGGPCHHGSILPQNWDIGRGFYPELHPKLLIFHLESFPRRVAQVGVEFEILLVHPLEVLGRQVSTTTPGYT